MRAATTWLAAVACAIGCGAERGTVDVVLERVGSEAATRPDVAATPRKLGVRTRNALSAAAFEWHVPPAATRLHWSTACVSDDDAPAAGAVFRIERRTATSPEATSEWAPISSDTTPSGDGWRDHQASLPPGGGDLRFAIDASPGCDGLWGSPLVVGSMAPAARPNIVLVSLDTLGAASLGTFSGQTGVSPHIDAFLDEGASFRRALVQYGNTLVSHSSLFSALYPRRHGVYTDVVPGPLRSSLVRVFADAGYRCAAFTEGAFVSAAFGFAVGFDAYDDGQAGLSNQMAGGAAETFDRAARWIEQAAGERFFVFLHTYEVHAPYLPRDAAALRVAARLTPGDDRVFPRDLQGLALLRHNSGQHTLPEQDLARLAALHVGEVHGLDAVLGRFLARLARNGLREDTLVVVTSDHGDQFGEAGKVGHGDSLHNRVLHVPLGFRWPGRIAPAVIGSPVQLIDVLPTLLELADLPIPPELDGTSLAPVLTRGAAPPERPAFSEQRSARGECTRQGLPNGCRLDRLAVQSGRFKLIESQLPVWQRLYDLERDPLEARDVSLEHPEEVEHLSALLAAYRTANAADPAEGAPALDAETLERLRELGYTEPGHQGF